MPVSVELPESLVERLDDHLEDDETYAEFIEELVNLYESEGQFYTEGYSED